MSIRTIPGYVKFVELLLLTFSYFLVLKFKNKKLFRHNNIKNIDIYISDKKYLVLIDMASFYHYSRRIVKKKINKKATDFKSPKKQ